MKEVLFVLPEAIWVLAVSVGAAKLPAQATEPFCLGRTLRYNCWRELPKAQPDGDSAKTAVRIARDARFDHLIGLPLQIDDPDAQSKIESRGFAQDRISDADPFPSSKSDLVVVATFSDYVPRVSNSRRSIYTELVFKVGDVLRQSSKVQVGTGDVIVSMLPGGSVRLRDGRNVRYALDGGDQLPLRLGGKYLLFLTYDFDTDSYSVLKHWGFENGTLVVADPAEMQKLATGKLALDPSIKEADLVDQIRRGAYSK